jgi:tRNA U34 2-thiouridine synthase MnmA/TrmU
MDMKKKLEDAYNPDKQGRKEKVLIGLSGGVDSLVTAYLLKIQKYELLAVTVVNNWDDLTLDPSQSLSCHISSQRLDQLKEFCQKLGVPHVAIKLSNEFKENVIEPWMGSKVVGRLSHACWDCHDLRMQTLFNKMKEVGATHLATGHYAKLFHHEGHGSVFVHTSNDEQFDQSSLLSRLNHDLLNHLLLPLSDLTKKEVLKLAENFGVGVEAKPLKIHECLQWKDEMATIFEKKMPKKFLREGELTNAESSFTIAQHTGIHPFTSGNVYEYRDSGKPMKGYIGPYNYLEKKLLIVNDKFLLRNRFLLVKCNFSEEVSWLEPVKGFIIFSGHEEVECWIYPKSLSSVHIELTDSYKVINGEILTVVKKKGKNSKIYLTGEVQFLPEEQAKEEGDTSVPKVNHSIDF